MIYLVYFTQIINILDAGAKEDKKYKLCRRRVGKTHNFFIVANLNESCDNQRVDKHLMGRNTVNSTDYYQ